MSKRRTILWLGILVALLPFLGFPSAWKTAVYVASGVLIAVNSYQLNKHKIIRSKRSERQQKDIPAAPSSVINDGISQKPPASFLSQSDSNHPFGGEPPVSL